MGDQFTLTPPTEREEGAWIPVPNNAVLTAKVLTVVKTLMPYKSRETNEDVYRVKWAFTVTQDGDFNGRKVEGQTSTAFVEHEDCKLYQWVKAVMNQDIPEGFSLDTDDLLGLNCVILVEATEKERTDGKGIWVSNKVIDVRPSTNEPVAAGSYGSPDYSEEPF